MNLHSRDRMPDVPPWLSALSIPPSCDHVLRLALHHDVAFRRSHWHRMIASGRSIVGQEGFNEALKTQWDEQPPGGNVGARKRNRFITQESSLTMNGLPPL